MAACWTAFAGLRYGSDRRRLDPFLTSSTEVAAPQILLEII